MFEVLGIMTIGIVVGKMISHRKRWVNLVEKATFIVILLLLLLLGIAIGGNKLLLSQFNQIAYNATIIALASILCSVLLGYLAYKFFFEKEQ